MASIPWAVDLEGGLLFIASLVLVEGLPFLIGHAVDDLARFVLGQRNAVLLGRIAIPVGQAVAAEAGKVHQVDVLHVAAFAQMRDQTAEGGGLEFGLLFVC